MPLVSPVAVVAVHVTGDTFRLASYVLSLFFSRHFRDEACQLPRAKFGIASVPLRTELGSWTRTHFAPIRTFQVIRSVNDQHWLYELLLQFPPEVMEQQVQKSTSHVKSCCSENTRSL